MQVGLEKPTTISTAILTNRTAEGLSDGEHFSKGVLQFSNESPDVEVVFNALAISQAVVSFPPRTVTWVWFVGTETQGVGGRHAGPAELELLPDDEPLRKVSDGMTDINFAMVAFEIANETQTSRVWDHFQAYESSFYEANHLSAPTWIAEQPETYAAGELNKRAPYKDCVAMARIWRYDAMMRRRLNDVKGILRTIGYANVLSDRRSGGGVGWFAERYDLGRFQPGDEAQATVPKYAGYPAIYNAFIIQENLLGLRAGVDGSIHIDPCVPPDWYQNGFGQTGSHVMKDHELSFRYRSEQVDGELQGSPGIRKMIVRIPPNLNRLSLALLIDGRTVAVKIHRQSAEFAVPVPTQGSVRFRLAAR